MCGLEHLLDTISRAAVHTLLPRFPCDLSSM